MNTTIREDVNNIINNGDLSDCRELSGKTVLVTGATGLIGSNLVKALLEYNNRVSNSIKVIALVRNIERARNIFGDDANLSIVVGDIIEEFSIEGQIDYIVHAASNTASKDFVNDPVKVIDVALKGTEKILKIARDHNVEGMVYLSTMEVYGYPCSDEKIDELHGTNLDTMSVRSSYPESKRMCESLCTAYHHQYGVPVKVIRLTQTIGPGIRYNDMRVFAEFARCVIEKKDIVLHTQGLTKRSYLYSADAVSAIITVLIRGVPGEAYNAANENSFCSIRDMAELVCSKCAGGNISIIVNEDDESGRGYAPPLTMNLDTTKIRELGWEPRYELREMFARLIESMSNDRALERQKNI